MTVAARAIAFYLPQFHPTAENDKWWGPGFTEWHNVARARPLFRGHEQPKLPGQLGFYDLRLGETRRQQAELAVSAGIESFAYWHYWFGGGRMILEKPFQMVLNDQDIGLGFCLAWANQSWTSSTWTAVHGRRGSSMLQEQTYPREDIERHFKYVLPAFEDPRYFRVDGKPLFYVMRPLWLPDLPRWVEGWRQLADRHGLPGLYLVTEEFGVDPSDFGFDATVAFPTRTESSLASRLRKPVVSFGHRFGFPKRFDYDRVMREFDRRPRPGWIQHPSVFAGWDSTPRRGRHGSAAVGFSPEAFREHVNRVVNSVAARDCGERLLFVKSWNEWAEGNYLEPDMARGEQLLAQFRAVMLGTDPGEETAP